MRTTNDVFINEKNSQTNAPVFLFTIYDYNGSTELRYAAYDSNVTFDGNTYTRFAINHESISENSNAQVDTVSMTLGNVSRLIQGYLENNDLRGKKVEIRLVMANQLADTSAVLKDTYYIDSFGTTQATANFTLTSKMDIKDIKIPSRIYSRTFCQWVFKEIECGYAGGDSECLKTKVDCKSKSNYVRFGAFPSINTRRTVLL